MLAWVHRFDMVVDERLFRCGFRWLIEVERCLAGRRLGVATSEPAIQLDFR